MSSAARAASTAARWASISRVAPQSAPRLRQRRLGACDLGLGRAQIGAQLVDVCSRDGAGLQAALRCARGRPASLSRAACASARLASACWISVGLPAA